MKKILKKILPFWLIHWYRRRKSLEFRNLSTQEVFTKIYRKNHWKSSESISGTGSEISQTQTLIDAMNKLLVEWKITSMLDIPCGDFKWMQRVDLSKVDYLGADIVEDLIKENTASYTVKANIRFQVLNLINDPLPQNDLIIVRDCLVHLSYNDIWYALQNIKASGCKYLLATTFTHCKQNSDIVTGDWRKLNLQQKPFSFPEPLLVINENCTEGNGAFRDKSMALWEIDQILLRVNGYVH
jgi:hypothetical protein